MEGVLMAEERVAVGGACSVGSSGAALTAVAEEVAVMVAKEAERWVAAPAVEG